MSEITTAAMAHLELERGWLVKRNGIPAYVASNGLVSVNASNVPAIYEDRYGCDDEEREIVTSDFLWRLGSVAPLGCVKIWLPWRAVVKVGVHPVEVGDAGLELFVNARNVSAFVADQVEAVVQ